MGDSVNIEFVRRLQAESQKQKFSEQVHTISSRCYDICFQDRRPPAQMDSNKSECIVNCVNRIMDASQFIVDHLHNGQGFKA